MVVMAKNQKSGFNRTCIDCKHIQLSYSTDIEDKDYCGLWLKIHHKIKDIDMPINGIPKWCPFD